jgi:hypothetical protein
MECEAVVGVESLLVIVFGGVVAAIVAGAYSRGTDMRTRRLEAADSYLAALVPAIIDLGEIGAPILVAATAGLGLEIVGSKTLEQAQADVRLAVRQLELLVARIELLFCPESGPANSAREGLNGVRNALNTLTLAQNLERDHLEQLDVTARYNDEFRRATEAHLSFASVVRSEVFRLLPRRRIHAGS